MSKPRILYISGSLGLGHVTRDLAIAAALRRHAPDVEISWLAAHPASMVLAHAGQRLLPEADRYENENIAAERAARGFSLNLMKYVGKALPGSVRNLRLFRRILATNHFDLVIGDEAYEIEIALRNRLVRLDVPYVVIHDFVGADPMTANPFERLLVYLSNTTWTRGRRPRDSLALFLGEPEDVPDRRFGLFLPDRRKWALGRYEFVGYALRFEPGAYADKKQVRTRLGYGEEVLIVCSIGGTAVGANLLELCGRAYPILKKQIDSLRMILVCGPRLSIDSIRVPEGVEVTGYVPNLYEHFAASDLAVVQGGLNTTLELTALRRPFIYFPLDGHFEQQHHVARRLERLRAGVRMSYSATTPELLADTILENLGKKPQYLPLRADGAERAAALIAGLIE